MRFDKSTRKNDIFGSGKPGKNENMDQVPGKPGGKLKKNGYGPWPSGFGQASVVGSLGAEAQRVHTTPPIFWTRQEFCNNSPKNAQN